MPIVRIEMYEGYSTEYKKQISDVVHNALVAAFKIPGDDRNQIIYEHNEEHFERRENKSRQFVIIEITAFKGRTKEAKKQLCQMIVSSLVKKPEIPENDILIVISEPELVNWGVAGEKCADEIDLRSLVCEYRTALQDICLWSLYKSKVFGSERNHVL